MKNITKLTILLALIISNFGFINQNTFGQIVTLDEDFNNATCEGNGAFLNSVNFTNDCVPPWYAVAKTPSIHGLGAGNAFAWMWATDYLGPGEAIAIDHCFRKGITYTVSFKVLTSDGNNFNQNIKENSTVNLVATNNAGDPTPDPSGQIIHKKKIAAYLTNWTNVTTSFTADDDYSQLWIFPHWIGVGSGQVELSIDDIKITIDELDACFDLPDIICENAPIIPDISCGSGPVTWHQWVITELNGAWEDRIVKHQIPAFGPVITFDLRNNWNGFEKDKCYAISLDVVTTCNGVQLDSDTHYEFFCMGERPPKLAGPDKIICKGSCVNIGIDPCDGVPDPCPDADITAEWFDIVPGINGTGLIQNVCPNETTDYIVKYTNGVGCVTYDTVTVVVEEPLTLVCEDVDICEGETYGYHPELPGISDDFNLEIVIDYGNGDVFIMPSGTYKSATSTVYATPGVYTMLVSVSNSCGTVTCERTITVRSHDECCKPDVSCFKIPSTICYGDSLWTDMSNCYYTEPVWHQWVITELNGAWENRVVKATIPQFGIPQNNNLSESWHEFEVGKTYAISFDVCVDCDGITVCNTVYRFVTIEDCCIKPACFELPSVICDGEPIELDFSCNELPNITSFRINIHEGQNNVAWKDYQGTLYNVDIKDEYAFQAGSSYNISVDFRYLCYENGVWVPRVKTVYRTITIYSSSYSEDDIEVTCGEIVNLNDYLANCTGGEWFEQPSNNALISPFVIINGPVTYIYKAVDTEDGSCCTIELNFTCTGGPHPFSESSTETTRYGFLEASWILYPNPSEGIFTLKNNIWNDDEPLNYLITDITGKQVVSSIQSSSSEIKIDISAFNDGVYFLKVSNTNVRKTFKLMKRN